MNLKKVLSIITTFLITLIFWLTFSAWNVYIVGYYELSRFFSGVVVALIVTLTMHELLTLEKSRNLKTVISRFLLYTFWQFYQIFLAAVDVSLRVLGIRDVNPQIIEFKTPLRSDSAITTLANSITLTPGTVTIDVDENGKFLVHAISLEPALSLVEDRTMINKVCHVFMEGENNDSPN
ncbi:MAG: Na+/H+ antiporter subunit E [Archaeoglobaceae archaeon]|nr:Na+/H+ antiporter subunit E [Archaeoglobaceae archaeon]